MQSWRGEGQNEVYVVNLHCSLGRLASALENLVKEFWRRSKHKLLHLTVKHLNSQNQSILWPWTAVMEGSRSKWSARCTSTLFPQLIGIIIGEIGQVVSEEKRTQTTTRQQKQSVTNGRKDGRTDTLITIWPPFGAIIKPHHHSDICVCIMFNVCLRRHNVKKFMTSKIRHDVKTFAMASKSLSWRQKHVMTSKTRHDVKRFVMTSEIRQKFEIKYVMTSKSSSWHKKTCHDIKKFAITTKIRSHYILFRNNKKLCQDDKNLVKKLVMRSKRVSGCHKMRQVVKTFHGVKMFVMTSIRATYVMTSNSLSDKNLA